MVDLDLATGLLSGCDLETISKNLILLVQSSACGGSFVWLCLSGLRLKFIVLQSFHTS